MTASASWLTQFFWKVLILVSCSIIFTALPNWSVIVFCWKQECC